MPCHLRLLAAAAVLAVPLAALAQDTGSATFTLQDDAFALPVPEGYCAPQGEQARMSRTIASWDSQNVTLADFQRCGSFGRDYVLIKSPRYQPPINVPRSTFLAAMQAQISSDALEQGMAKGQSDVARGSRWKVAVSKPDFGFDGVDDTCLYLAGTIEVSAEGGMAKARVASCVTLVGRRNLAIHAFDFDPAGAGIETLKARSRAIAASIAAQ